MPDALLPEFTIEKGRYRLYAAMNCPFAHRVRMMRLLQDGLEDAFAIAFADDQTKEEGFVFREPEPEFGEHTLRDVYKLADPSYEGKYSVPVIIDRTTKKIVNNESLDSSFALAKLNGNTILCPQGAEELAKELSNTVTMAPYKFLLSGRKPEVVG